MGAEIELVVKATYKSSVNSENDEKVVTLGRAINQFARYVFRVPSAQVRDLLRSSTSSSSQLILRVTFNAKGKNDVAGRFMACSGGWDWAPYSQTCDTDFAPNHLIEKGNTFSFGLWKSVYALVGDADVEAEKKRVEQVEQHDVELPVLEHMLVQPHYTGAYPVGGDAMQSSGAFRVEFRAVLLGDDDEEDRDTTSS